MTKRLTPEERLWEKFFKDYVSLLRSIQLNDRDYERFTVRLTDLIWEWKEDWKKLQIKSKSTKKPKEPEKSKPLPRRMMFLDKKKSRKG